MRRAGRSPTRVAPTDDAGRCHSVLRLLRSLQPPDEGDDPAWYPMIRCARHRPGQVMRHADQPSIPRTSTLMSTVDTRPPIGGHGVRPGVPPPPEPTVHPVRTLHRLTDAGGAGATVIEAPAGWGKTTLMTAWTQIARRVGRVAWLTVDPTDPPTTASWLADALAPYRVLPDGEEPVPGTHLVLIDDVQHLWSPAALAGLDDTTLPARPVVRFVLAGRGPLAALRRWRLSGHCLEAGPTDLAMDHADTRALLRAHRLDLADTAALRLHALTEGWP